MRKGIKKGNCVVPALYTSIISTAKKHCRTVKVHFNICLQPSSSSHHHRQHPRAPPSPLIRTASVDNSLMVIPTFTVTINPLEDNEITYVPDSPGEESRPPPRASSLDSAGGGGSAAAGSAAGSAAAAAAARGRLSKQLSMEVRSTLRMNAQPPESPYTRRKIVIFLRRKISDLRQIWRNKRNCAKKLFAQIRRMRRRMRWICAKKK